MEAHGVRNLGYQYHHRAAELYKRFANNKDISPSDILIEEYEPNQHSTFHDMSPLIFELFANHPNARPEDILYAANALDQLCCRFF